MKYKMEITWTNGDIGTLEPIDQEQKNEIISALINRPWRDVCVHLTPESNRLLNMHHARRVEFEEVKDGQEV